MAANVNELTARTLEVTHAADTPRLRFRSFAGEPDYENIRRISMRAREGYGDPRAISVEDVRNDYEHLVNCDPARDMIFAEIDGEAVAYGRTMWWLEDSTGDLIYHAMLYIDPAAHGLGLREPLVRWLEGRRRAIAAGHDQDRRKFLSTFAPRWREGRVAFFEARGYAPVAYFASMVRPTLEDIPDAPLPAGLEMRPVTPDHYRTLWEADREAFRDHWGFNEAEYADEQFEAWQNSKVIFQPHLWCIAWDGDEVAGQVRSFIHHEDNEAQGRKRGYTEFISVGRPWRRQGVATALIAASLRVLKEQGMEEAALGVHTDNPNGAHRLYEKMGYRVVNEYVVMHREIEEGK